jgi:hypothetical protein
VIVKLLSVAPERVITLVRLVVLSRHCGLLKSLIELPYVQLHLSSQAPLIPDELLLYIWLLLNDEPALRGPTLAEV